MTDSQRDEIDSEAQRFIQMSRDMINSLQEASALVDYVYIYYTF